MRNLKETNSFYQTEKSDTRLKFSVAVPNDLEGVMEAFKPIENFGFQENFRNTLNSSELRKMNNPIVKVKIRKIRG